MPERKPLYLPFSTPAEPMREKDASESQHYSGLLEFTVEVEPSGSDAGPIQLSRIFVLSVDSISFTRSSPDMEIV